MGLAQCCDVCGNRFPREISKFCAVCGEKRLEQEVMEEEENVAVEDEGNMRGPPARFALQEKCVNRLSYIQVFAPPVCRDENKKYGKKALLAANMGIQHRIMLDNYETAKKWVRDAQGVGRLPSGAFSLEEEGVQERLRQIIKENCKKLQEIKLGKKNHKWDEREIYRYLKKHLRYLRRKERNLKNLIGNNENEGEESNEFVNESPVEENRELLQIPVQENRDFPEETTYGEDEPPPTLEDDENFLLVVLGLPTVDVVKRHLKKVMKDVNARVTPKPFGVGYRQWDKDKQVKEVANYYRNQRKQSVVAHEGAF